MAPNRNIFCNAPWYELHIYWDGALGICCHEDHKLYPGSETQYNIANMSIKDWFNSEPARQFRSAVLGDHAVSQCQRCYVEEQNGGNSKRIKNNQKSVIFTRTAFADSFDQSPGRRHFESHGHTNTMPIDLHVDLGNFCNLACKMCNPMASSRIASQQVIWGIESSRKYLGTNWTANQSVWDSFKHQLLDIPNLKNIHFMGGETLLTDRFEDFVDFMIQHQRFDLCFSFVTNGTVFKADLMDKLSKFSRVGIEVSIETVDEHNAYQRQGTDTALVLSNIDRYQQWCNNTSITVTLRPAISALTVGYYPGLLEYALNREYIIKSLIVQSPKFLSVAILPDKIKKEYSSRYQSLLNQLSSVSVGKDYNASDPNNFRISIREQVDYALNLLSQPTPNDYEIHLLDLVKHCRKWDQVYSYDAYKLYPEFKQILEQYGY